MGNLKSEYKAKEFSLFLGGNRVRDEWHGRGQIAKAGPTSSKPGC